MVMEKLVKSEVLGENLPQCRFVHHKTSHAARTRTRAVAVGSQRLTGGFTYLHCFSCTTKMLLHAMKARLLTRYTSYSVQQIHIFANFEEFILKHMD
jgi:hypothetical protein